MGGRRLRVEGQKRTENEYKQMLRLAEIENKELKDSLRYVEIQLAKTKENLRISNKNFAEAQSELQNCNQQIARQANINHAQISQLEDMAKKLSDVDIVQKEIHEKHKIKLNQYQIEIDIREAEKNRVEKEKESVIQDLELAKAELKQQKEQIEDLDMEMEMKSGENNRLRKQVADIEAAMQDLYRSRKGKGTEQIVIDSLQSDNQHLISLLKSTSEYADVEDSQILKSAATKNLQGLKDVEEAFSANKIARGGSVDPSKAGTKSKPKLNNDWIPTEAVKAILEIKEKFGANMTEFVISQILYKLNAIWRNIMRQEQEAVRRRLVAQIQDLRRQIVTKQAYDKGELMSEISRTKKQLGFANKKLHNQERIGGNENSNSLNKTHHSQSAQQLRETEKIGIRKRQLEEENHELRSRISVLEQDKSHSNPKVMSGTGVIFDGITNSYEAL